MSAISDPLGQIHSPANFDHYSHLQVVLFCEILKSGDGRKEIVITIGRDCGSAEWINFSIFYRNHWRMKRPRPHLSSRWDWL